MRKFEDRWCCAGANVLGLSACLTVAALAGAQVNQTESGDVASPQTDAQSQAPPQFLRVVEDKNKSIALEIAAHTFIHPGGGPRIGLVGVAHIGDRSFYQSVQKLLDEYDVVLFESVKPPGTGGAGGLTDQERIDSTKAAMQFIGGVIEAHHARTKHYPIDLKTLEDFAGAEDARLARFVQIALIDAWGGRLVYQRQPAPAAIENPAEPPHGYTLVSLGADRAPGGEGINSDLSLADQHPPDPLAFANEDGLQSQLAQALNLEFQLEALSYDKPNWRCSDMAMDELDRRLQAKGLNFDILGGTLAGSSLPANIIKILLKAMKAVDAFFDGAITDVFKVLMIEMLGNEKLIEVSLQQFGQGFSEVIVNDRNQIAIDDLKALIEREPEVKSVAILYGAAHMPDMAARLTEQLGYQLGPDDQQRWLPAIKVDLANSAVSPRELTQIRLMIRQMIRQQMRAR